MWLFLFFVGDSISIPFQPKNEWRHYKLWGCKCMYKTCYLRQIYMSPSIKAAIITMLFLICADFIVHRPLCVPDKSWRNYKGEKKHREIKEETAKKSTSKQSWFSINTLAWIYHLIFTFLEILPLFADS